MEPPVVPIYPILRKDLIFSHEANPTWSEKLVNFEKLRKIARIIRETMRLSSVPYDTELLMEPGFSGDLTAASIRKATTAGVAGKQATNQSRKKLYEQTLMVRKVKSYLGSLQVIESELDLDRMSLECEPQPTNSNSLGAANVMSQPRRRGPSPSPSSLSSHSNQSDQRNPSQQRFAPKFGVESPQAVQKMLSLVQTSRIKTQSVQRPQLPPGSIPSKKSSLSSPAGTVATVGSSNGSHTGTTPQTMRRMPSFNSKSVDGNGHNEMGVDVGPN